ncbi:MAG TPA: tRNA (cytidine(34)-2'-O)-methyltransferase [Steroidobacteraceae bacterium]|nr:tRNA (cytidine(34)-2'-O)-methyltransferase [Steroidobacteraceae bacterium]
MFHVVLHEPEIPANTGNLIRLCANAGCELHVIEPLGFRLDRRSVRRAALDYEELTVLHSHSSLAACQCRIGGVAPGLTSSADAASAGAPRWYAIETGGVRPYSEVAFRPGDALLFGSETRGLPREILQSLPQEQRLYVPMRPGNRSLNLSNCVALVVYEAWRQNGFGSAATLGRASQGDRCANRTPA